jgi:hypothetical protein
VLAGKNNLRVLDAFGLQDGRAVRWLPNARAEHRGLQVRARRRLSSLSWPVVHSPR